MLYFYSPHKNAEEMHKNISNHYHTTSQETEAQLIAIRITKYLFSI